MWLQDLLSDTCPYCGESIELLVDVSVAEQEYFEDCQVCCRPMLVHCYATDEETGGLRVTVKREDE